MSPLDLLRSVAGSDDTIEDRPHPSSHFSLEYDDLEPRQLLSAVQGTTSTQTTAAQAVGATAGMGSATEVGSQVPGGYSVVNHAVGDVNSLQSQIPVNDILSNLSQVPVDVYNTDTGISASTGLTSLPITPLLPLTVTENETPLNNGTPDLGTVWITLPPLPTGVFHMETTELPLTSNTWMQTVNPQGGPPTFTHFGQGANGSMNGASVNQPVAVGPIGPSMTEEIEPVQPPSVEAHQEVGPPTQVQQDETTPQQNAQTPPGGQQGAGQPGTPGQESAPGQSPEAAQGHSRSSGGETTQGVQATTPHSPNGPGAPGGGNQGQLGGTGGAAGGMGDAQTGGGQAPAGGAQGGTGGGSSGGGAFLIRPGDDQADPDADPAIELIDEAIPVLVSNSYHHVDDADDAGALPTVFGAAAVAAGGFHLALRSPERFRRGLAGGRPDGADPDADRKATV